MRDEHGLCAQRPAGSPDPAGHPRRRSGAVIMLLRRGWVRMGERATFGAELRRLRRAAGLSLSGLADRVHYSKGYLSKVETGLTTPNSALAALCEAELDAAGALTALLPREPARRRTRPDVRASGLPAASGDFTGRAEELRAVRDALETDGGVCVISGMGGVGKTALAVRCAHRLEAGFADGCLFVDLRGHGEAAVDPAALHDRLLRVLGVPAERIPADPDDRAAAYRSRLRGRSLLLVLDNAADAAQVRPLLPAEPKCRVLITSRSRLTALDEARHVSLDVLPAEAAAGLFTALTGADAADAARVADRCGRLPLALRIAAARLRAHPAWDVAELDRRLAGEAERLGELDDGERSLSAAFRLSARQLGDAEARLFGLLALHPGSDVDLHAASALAGLEPRETDRLLDRLHDAYLVTQPAADRYGFHDLLRAFAAETGEAALEPEERQAAFGRLAAFAVRGAERADRLLAPQRYRPVVTYPGGLPAPGPLDGVAWFRAEWPNLVALCRRAGELGEHERCWQLAFFLRGYFFLAKLWDEWITTHRWARAAAEKAGDRWAVATTTANLGIALIDRGDLDGASECFREALREYRAIGDRHGENTALAHHAWADHYRGEHRTALRDFLMALEFYEQIGNRRSAAITNRGIALVRVALGEAAEAAELAAGTLTVFDELGLDHDAVLALNCLGWARFHTGELDLAAAAYREAAARAEACESDHEAARAYTGLGNVAVARGATEEAAGYWARADETGPALDPVVVGETRVRPS
jgi:transcriptional regulator with XRE-family HTH domain/tetratricopeptide (TPR) repeat protein